MKCKILILPRDHAGPRDHSRGFDGGRRLDRILEPLFEISHEITGNCSFERHEIPITAAVLDQAEQSHAVPFGRDVLKD